MKRKPLFLLIKEKYPEIDEKTLYASIMCGRVLVNDERIRDPKMTCRADSVITIDSNERFVSRGGEKLDRIIDDMGIDCYGKIMIDCGASTGGFTDCLLQRGAKIVYSVDVGYSQIDYKLRQNPGVRVLERTNLFALSCEHFDVQPDAAVMDVSFRSLRSAATHIISLVREHWVLALVKPQYEWLNPPPSFDGVVRDPNLQRRILLSLVGDLWKEKVVVLKAQRSPLKGRKGNAEYFFLMSNESGSSLDECSEKIEKLF